MTDYLNKLPGDLGKNETRPNRPKLDRMFQQGRLSLSLISVAFEVDAGTIKPCREFQRDLLWTVDRN